MTSIKELVDINDRSIELLNSIGVRTSEQLLEAGATASGRMRMSDEANLDDETLLRWVHEADLMRVHGIGPELANLLCKVGVLTSAKLAYRSSENLHEVLSNYKSENRQPGRIPSVSELGAIISSAKLLPKIIRH